MHKIEGKFIINNVKIAIIASRFNELIVSKLISGAEDGLVRHGIDSDDIDLIWVPGAFELPLAAQRAAKTEKYDAIICLGAVIRGNTPHFEYVSAEVSKGVAHVGLNADLPVIFGVLTVDSIEQAIERAGTKAGNKGYEAALSAIEMISLFEVLS